MSKFKFTQEELDEICIAITQFKEGDYFMNHITEKVESILSERYVSDDEISKMYDRANSNALISNAEATAYHTGLLVMRSRIFKTDEK